MAFIGLFVGIMFIGAITTKVVHDWWVYPAAYDSSNWTAAAAQLAFAATIGVFFIVYFDDSMRSIGARDAIEWIVTKTRSI